MDFDANQVLRMFHNAKALRQQWEPLWQDCYDYTQPHRTISGHTSKSLESKRSSNLYDSTGCDAVQQLAASMVAELAPPLTNWFAYRAGSALDSDPKTTNEVEKINKIARDGIVQSNFSVELHQAFLDLVTIGTACLLVESSAPGSPTPFKFTAIPPRELYIQGENHGELARIFRNVTLDRRGLAMAFPKSEEVLSIQEDSEDAKYSVVEVFEEREGNCHYSAFVQCPDKSCHVVEEGKYQETPVLVFRWNKSSGEIYGRSPVMTALPDIKTANKVVELILKNASISVTGIWLAEDDGILNLKNIKMTPGSIIPKAVGSKGLTPLAAPGRFDVSQIVLSDLRQKIRHTLLIDKLDTISSKKMTATEVNTRNIEMDRLLGAVFGRLQSELLQPLLRRLTRILINKGHIPNIPLNENGIVFEYRSPMARAQDHNNFANAHLLMDSIRSLQASDRNIINASEMASWLVDTLGLPKTLIADEPPLEELLSTLDNSIL